MATPRRLTSKARNAGHEVSAARADARAIALAPVIAEIKASGIEEPYAVAAALTARGVRTARGHRHWGHMQASNLLLRLERLSVAGLINQDITINHAADPEASARRTPSPYRQRDTGERRNISTGVKPARDSDPARPWRMAGRYFEPIASAARLKAIAMAFPITSLSKMTAAEFAAALKANGFRVVKAKIEDATGQCPGIRWMALRAGPSTIDYDGTLAKIIRQRDAEIARVAGVDRGARLTQKMRRTGWETRMKRAAARPAAT
jgi:hypothetical protein